MNQNLTFCRLMHEPVHVCECALVKTPLVTMTEQQDIKLLRTRIILDIHMTTQTRQALSFTVH